MSTEFDKSGQGTSKQLITEIDRSCQGTSRQVPENLFESNLHHEEFFDLSNPLNIENLRQRNKQLARDKSSAESRIKIMEEVIAAKSKAQMARAEELMARIRAIELVQVQEHVNKQLLHLNQLIDSKARPETPEEDLTPCSIGRSVYETDYDNSLIDCIEQEMQEEGNEDHPLKSQSVLSYARFLYHKRERRTVKSVSHVLGEIIKNTLPDNTETDSDSDDETGEEDVLYRTVPKDKVCNYRPINSTPVAKWAKYRSHTISSWAWLNHAMTEVDFRFKKQDALYNHMRKAKPTFKLESPQPSSSSPSTIQLKDVQGVTMFSNPGETPAFQLRFQNSAELTDMSRNKDQVKLNESGRTHTTGPNSNTLYEGAGSSGLLNLLADVSELSESVQRENIEKVINTIQHNRSADQVNQVIQLSSNDGEVDVTQVASRCRPMSLCKPRKVFKMNHIHIFMNEKLDPVPTDGCACKIGTACIFCLGNKIASDIEFKSFRERIEFLEPGFHKSLSTPDDMPIEVILHKALQELEICDSDDEEERDILKPFVSVGPEDLRPQRAPSERETVTVLEQQITKRGRGRPPNRPPGSPIPQSSKSNYSPDITWPGGYQSVPTGAPKKKKSKVSVRKRQTKRKDSRKSGKKKEDTEDSEFEDELAEIVQSNTAFKAAYKKLRAGRRRSDFDINNIVIPSHYSANTRVEKLLYKEIIIPSFREINFEPQMSDESFRRPKKAGIKRVKRFLQKIDDDYEDLDDELIKARHDRCEEEERRKFSSAIPKTSNRRRRNTKSESNDGGKISDSVEVHEVISSEEASLAASALKVSQGRRRTISVSKKEEEEAKECSIAPYAPRQFPLPNELYEEMKKDMPDDFFSGSP